MDSQHRHRDQHDGLSAGRRKAPRWAVAVTAVVAAGCLAGGAALIVSGSRSHPPPPGPLPVRQFAVDPAALAKLPPMPRPRRHRKVTVTGGYPGVRIRCSIPVTRSHLVIGSLCVNAPITPSAQQPDGVLAVPRDVHQVGMWDGGAQLTGPGGQPARHGTTLLAGHVDYIGQGAGTLYNLYQVQPGAVVYTAGPSGRVTRWQITSLSVVPKTQLPSWVFGGKTGPRKLVIVTCGGPIEYTRGQGYSYRDNVIATAVPA